MAVTQRIDLRQAQSLVMTPQLQQAIKLLELSNQDLIAYVETELEQNPLLERGDDERSAESSAGSADDSREDLAERTEGSTDRMLDAAEYNARETMPDERDSPLDTDYNNTYSSAPQEGMAGGDLYDGAWRGTGGRSDFDDGEYGIEQTGRPKTLREHLEEQLHLDITDPTERIIGLQIIDMLDAAGYVGGDLAQLAERLSCPIALVEQTLLKLQQFEPCGVFARDLAECLALQLRERDRLDPAMQMLL